MAVIDAVLMFVQEYKDTSRRRRRDFSRFFIHFVPPLSVEKEADIDSIHVAVHGITADPEVFLATQHGAPGIGRTTIDRGRAIIREKSALRDERLIGRVRTVILHV